MLVSGTAAAAILAKAALDEFLVFIRRMGIAEMGIDCQPAFDALPQKVMVDLILCDEHFTLAQKAWLGGETAFRVGQAIQYNADPVGVVSG